MRGRVVKRGKKEGSWTLVYDLPRIKGQPRQRASETFRGTKREAESKLRQRLDEVERGLVSKRGTVAEFLEQWLKGLKSRVMVESGDDRDIAPSTFVGYEKNVRLYLAPYLGSIQLAALNPFHIQEALEQWRNIEPRRGEQLSRRTIHHAYSTLRTALQAAVYARLIPANPAKQMTPPKKGARSLGVITLPDAAKLLAHNSLDPIHVAVVFDVITGLRRSELLALRWEDVDLEAGTAFVHRALTTLLDGRFGFKENKTQRSRRLEPIEEPLPTLLRAYRSATTGLVFPHPKHGGIWPPHSFRAAFDRHMKKLGIEGASIQRLRHAFATYTPDKNAASLALGHGSLRMTSHYTHADTEAVRAAQRALIERLRAPNGHQIYENDGK